MNQTQTTARTPAWPSAPKADLAIPRDDAALAAVADTGRIRIGAAFRLLAAS